MGNSNTKSFIRRSKRETPDSKIINDNGKLFETYIQLFENEAKEYYQIIEKIPDNNKRIKIEQFMSQRKHVVNHIFVLSQRILESKQALVNKQTDKEELINLNNRSNALINSIKILTNYKSFEDFLTNFEPQSQLILNMTEVMNNYQSDQTKHSLTETENKSSLTVNPSLKSFSDEIIPVGLM